MYRRKFFVRDLPPYYRKVFVVPSMDDVPANLSKNIFLVNRGGVNRWVVLACPCGCGERLDVNLMSNRRPYWRLRHHRGAVSLLPSLWVPKDRCGSHFWLIRNRVLWAESDWSVGDRTGINTPRQTLSERLRAAYRRFGRRRSRA